MIKMKAQLAGNKGLAQIAAVRKAWVDAMQVERKTIEALYKRTTETWKYTDPRTTPVVFKSKIKSTKKELYVQVWTSNRIYWFVHESIDTMHAIFSNDWSPKTRPNSLRSVVGSGQVVRIRPEYEGKPYKARKFTETIIKVREKGFQKLMENATRVGARAASQGG